MDSRSQRISLLIIEDSRGDFVLMEEYLNEVFQLPSITHAQTYRQASELLASGAGLKVDCILLDLSLPDKSGTDLIHSIMNLAGDQPIIVFTGYSDLDFSIKSLSMGVSDYLLKDELSPPLLHKSIVYSIERFEFASRIKESEKKYRELFELNPEPMWLYDRNTLEILDVNHAAVAHYGFSKEEFLDLRLRDIHESEELPAPAGARNGSSGDVTTEPEIFTHRKKSGELIRVEIEAKTLVYNNRDSQLILASDVTEKLKAEERRKLLESVIKNIDESVLVIDAAFDRFLRAEIVYANKGFEQMTGYTAGEVTGKRISTLFGEETDEAELFKLREAYRTSATGEAEFRIRKTDGTTFWSQTSLVPVRDNRGVPTHYVAISRNITEHKEKERKLQESVAEKEVLLSEIHHRVKNNLALVSGMLQMQVFDEDDEKVLSKLNNSMLRVGTMASIHELLYESNSFSRLEFSKIIHKLIESTHDSFSAGREIDIEIHTEPFELDINQAVPCSLIINEAVTNTYKHAFKGRKRGWIRADLHREGDEIRFTLEDDGNGLPEDFDMSELSSLGTKIITALVKQLNGSFELVPREGGGTRFSLRFQAEVKKGTGNTLSETN